MTPVPPTATPRSLATAIGRVPGFVLKKAKRWLVSQYYARYFENNPGHRALSEARAKAAVADAERILFLCWGNICRSPMAERYLRSRLDDRGVEGVDLVSAGWGQYEGRPSPAHAIESAGLHGVDLGDHRSRLLSEDLVGAVDVAFVMDYNDFHAVTVRHPETADDTYFLRTMLGDASETQRVPDPHGRGQERFEEAYETIAEAMDEMARVLDDDEQRSTATEGDR